MLYCPQAQFLSTCARKLRQHLLSHGCCESAPEQLSRRTDRGVMNHREQAAGKCQQKGGTKTESLPQGLVYGIWCPSSRDDRIATYALCRGLGPTAGSKVGTGTCSFFVFGSSAVERWSLFIRQHQQMDLQMPAHRMPQIVS